jgi:hypothetical protein
LFEDHCISPLLRLCFVWVSMNNALVGWLFLLSVVMFVGSLLAIPWIVVRIPHDYFLNRRRFLEKWRNSHPIIRIPLWSAKNLLGLVFLLAGVVMLFTPGQGILTILVGLLFIDFPGKFALERWFIKKSSVHRTINWMRKKAKRPPLQLPDDEAI